MTEGLELRSVQITDLAVILSWWNDPAYYPATGIAAPVTPDMVSDRFQSKGEEQWYVICAGTVMIGMVGFRANVPCEATVTIGTVIIDRKWQGRGWGRQAIAVLEQMVGEKFGAGVCRAPVLADNTRGRAFWEGMGYVVKGRGRAQGVDVVVCVKELE